MKTQVPKIPGKKAWNHNKKHDKNSLDMELDNYMMKNEKFAKTRLDVDIDNYMMEVDDESLIPSIKDQNSQILSAVNPILTEDVNMKI